jgi:membrane protease YdiL (CAAX protease family)
LALLQQTLLQFYLLGRLLALFPKRHPVVPITITGVGFALVHLPDVWALATIPAGIIWTFIYYRYRFIWPLALSHAALGSAFCYGLFGQDLAAEWRSFLP